MPSFQNPDGSAFNETFPLPVVSVPTTGNTVAMAFGNRYLFINPAGTLSALTVLLPPNPFVGMPVDIISSQIVTTLTLQDSGGNAITHAASALAVYTKTSVRYISPAIGWVGGA